MQMFNLFDILFYVHGDYLNLIIISQNNYHNLINSRPSSTVHRPSSIVHVSVYTVCVKLPFHLVVTCRHGDKSETILSLS